MLFQREGKRNLVTFPGASFLCKLSKAPIMTSQNKNYPGEREEAAVILY